MAGDRRADRLLVGHAARDELDVVALGLQLRRGLLERVRLARGEGKPVALSAEGVRQRIADAPRGSGDEGGAVGHGRRTVHERLAVRARAGLARAASGAYDTPKLNSLHKSRRDAHESHRT